MQADEWTVDDLERRINAWPSYIVRMKAVEDVGDSEEVDLHFVHVKSHRTDAVPLMLLHGWPGNYNLQLAIPLFYAALRNLLGLS